MTRLRIFTWHVHGSYLYYLAHVPHDIYLPARPDRRPGYGGRTASFPWPVNVHEVPVDAVRALSLDLILFQSLPHFQHDQYQILSEPQRRLPKIYLEHDPPREHPTDTRHPVQDPRVLLVHVTPFNALMWDSGVTPSRVIEHGVRISRHVRYDGSRRVGVVAINNLATRGRRLGLDIYLALRRDVPLELVGMGSDETPGGVGEVPPMDVPAFLASRRFYLSPIRYTSLGLATIEAMMAGVPVVGLATTELATVIEPGVTGFVATDPGALVEPMRALLADHALAHRIGEAGRRVAERRFGLRRFVADWCDAVADVVGGRHVAARLRPTTREHVL